MKIVQNFHDDPHTIYCELGAGEVFTLDKDDFADVYVVMKTPSSRCNCFNLTRSETAYVNDSDPVYTPKATLTLDW